MDEITLTPEFIIIVTSHSSYPAEPDIGLFHGGVEVEEIEVRDGDDNLIEIDGLNEYLLDKHRAELEEIVAEAYAEAAQDAIEGRADYEYQQMKDEGRNWRIAA